MKGLEKRTYACSPDVWSETNVVPAPLLVCVRQEKPFGSLPRKRKNAGRTFLQVLYMHQIYEVRTVSRKEGALGYRCQVVPALSPGRGTLQSGFGERRIRCHNLIMA